MFHQNFCAMRMPTLLLGILALCSVGWAERTSSNDPFRAISTQVVRKAEEPVCCLIPLDDPPETSEDNVLLSFEQWKDRQASSQSVNRSRASSTTSTAMRVIPTGSDPTAESASVQETAETQNLSPHFQVPLTDRFNYAALDCSARVHLSHRSAKSPASILSSKKDRYMLSPCNSKDAQFVVVELCDDIRIDTVQLANFEFFSGVFMDFTVSVAKTYTTHEDGWTVVGTYRGQNVRTIQSFHPPTSIRDFYRYIKIQFHSHYSNEYYCPISLLRVYGLTHLEQWKWDTWESEYRARMDDVHEPEPEIPITVARPTTTEVAEPVLEYTPPVFGPSTYEHLWQDTSTTTTFTTESAPIIVGHDENRHSTDIYSDDLSSSVPTTTQTPLPDSTSVSTVVVPTTISISMPAPPPPPPPSGGESIYRTIMNRLTALEGNHTLYVRYVDEQTHGIRDLIQRLGEDVGRLEGIGRSQTQAYHRKLREWDKQRRRLEDDYHQLQWRVGNMEDEVVLEKRLGIAQLCLLLAVLVFMGLTRGSRSEHPTVVLKKGMREWGRRHLSMSLGGDWFAREGKRSPQPTSQQFKLTEPPFKRSPQLFEGRVQPTPSTPAPVKSEIEFPTSPQPQPTPNPLPNTTSKPFLYLDRPRKTSTPKSVAMARSRSHTPNPTRHGPISNPPRAHTPTSSRPHYSGNGHVRSARRWARTAHLHQLRVDTEENVFSSPRKEREVLTSTTRDVLTREMFASPSKRGVETATTPGMGRRERDMFSSPSKRRDPNGNGNGVDDLWAQRSRWRETPTPSDDGEMDQWMDTDGDVSVDGDGESGVYGDGDSSVYGGGDAGVDGDSDGDQESRA